jgi:CHAT domain-containing protein
LQGLSVTRSPRLKFQVLASTATSLRFDQPESAIAFHDAALATLQGGGRSASRVEVLASRAHTLISLGRLSDAAVTIAEARRELESVTDPAFHQLLELVVLSPEGELQRRSDPAAAAATAERALRIMAERKSPSDRSRLPHFQLQLAKANIASGREQLAEHALGEGIRAFEEERAAITDEGLISAFDPKWELLETGIELAIRKGELERAFALSERARARSLAESRRAPEAWSLAEIRAALDPDVAIVALNQFEHELAVWVIRRDIATVTMRPLSRLDAERLVSRQHEEIWRESTTALAGRELYNEILRPTVTELRGAARVVFIPDATFENAAFSALWDPARRRFLVEDFAVAVAPSAESYMSAAMRDADAWQSELLIVGGPTSVSSANVAAIAPLYRAANVVTGASATGTRFLSDAPKHTVIHVVAETTTHKTHPLLSRITLADEPGRPYTGVVLGRDIAAKSMSATKFVVLDESRTSIEQRGEGTLKLARAFMTAGVPAVLGTLPGADEHATRDLMIGFHREMTTGITPGQALARVQRNALQQNGRRLGAWTALVIYGSDR